MPWGPFGGVTFGACAAGQAAGERVNRCPPPFPSTRVEPNGDKQTTICEVGPDDPARAAPRRPRSAVASEEAALRGDQPCSSLSVARSRRASDSAISLLKRG